MGRWTWWDYLQFSGALASVLGTGYAVLGSQFTDVTKYILGLSIMASLLVTVIPSFLNKLRGPRPMARQEVVRTGRQLISNAKKQVVVFGGDMSWASDYAEAIEEATVRGKQVVVLYPQADAKAKKALQNAQILQNAGATLLATPVDSGLRGYLLDPYDYEDACLFVVNRKLLIGSLAAEPGERGTSSSYQYVGKVYTSSQDWLMIRTVTKVYEMLRERGIQ